MKIRAPFSIFGGRGYLRLITVDVIIVEAAGTGNTPSGKVTESLTADALVLFLWWDLLTRPVLHLKASW